jgi:hypothetical protein
MILFSFFKNQNQVTVDTLLPHYLNLACELIRRSDIYGPPTQPNKKKGKHTTTSNESTQKRLKESDTAVESLENVFSRESGKVYYASHHCMVIDYKKLL